MGAYTSSLLALQYGISPWIGLVLGACVAAVLGLLIGLPSAIAAPLRQMIYGLLLVILMLKRPQGLVGEYRFR